MLWPFEYLSNEFHAAFENHFEEEASEDLPHSTTIAPAVP